MTIKEFFRKARRSREWGLTLGQVRCADGMCPLGAVAKLPSPWYKGKYWGVPHPGDAARKLGLRKALASRIARAADWNTRYRPWLLKNLGIR